MMSKDFLQVKQLRILFLLFLGVGCMGLQAEEVSKQAKMTIQQKMQILLDNMYNNFSTAAKAPKDKLPNVEKQISKTDMQWESLYSTQQSIITEDSLLLNMAGDYQSVKQSVVDTIAARKHYFESLDEFKKTEDLIRKSEPIYDDYVKKAMQLSMVQKLAPVLEKLKAEEKNGFAKIQTSYDKAKEIETEFPELEERLKILDEKFLSLQMNSGKVQAAAYKPLMTRIKDYIMGLAAVSMILMYANTLQSKLKNIKQQKENMKKMQEALNKNNGEVPTI